jgi:hypothetical protein
MLVGLNLQLDKQLYSRSLVVMYSTIKEYFVFQLGTVLRPWYAAV